MRDESSERGRKKQRAPKAISAATDPDAEVLLAHSKQLSVEPSVPDTEIGAVLEMS